MDKEKVQQKQRGIESKSILVERLGVLMVMSTSISVFLSYLL